MFLSDETIRQIPIEIRNCIQGICQEHHIQEQFRDFWEEIEQAKRTKGEEYYDGIPLEDLVKYASVGTEIAFQLLEQLEEGSNLDSGIELVLSRLLEELGADYGYRHIAYHFVSNPLKHASTVTNEIANNLDIMAFHWQRLDKIHKRRRQAAK